MVFLGLHVDLNHKVRLTIFAKFKFKLTAKWAPISLRATIHQAEVISPFEEPDGSHRHKMA